MDKAHRVPATPATCYTKKEGDFLPQHLLPSQDDLFTPAFRREVKEKESFFLLEEAFLNDSGRLSLYAHHILNECVNAFRFFRSPITFQTCLKRLARRSFFLTARAMQNSSVSKDTAWDKRNITG